MGKIEQLTAAYALCREIPLAAFNDSALVWAEWERGLKKRPFVRERNSEWDIDAEMRAEADEQAAIPAPTASELLEALHPLCSYAVRLERAKGSPVWRARCAGKAAEAESPADALLALWLQCTGNAKEAADGE